MLNALLYTASKHQNISVGNSLDNGTRGALVKRVKRGHVFLGELEVVNVGVGLDPAWGLRLW